MVENQNSILHCSHHRQMVDQLHGGRSVPSTAWPRWLRRDACAIPGDTITRWWTSCMVDDRCHPPRGRGGYEEVVPTKR
jgi:hypothetical protein